MSIHVISSILTLGSCEANSRVSKWHYHSWFSPTTCSCLLKNSHFVHIAILTGPTTLTTVDLRLVHVFSLVSILYHGALRSNLSWTALALNLSIVSLFTRRHSFYGWNPCSRNLLCHSILTRYYVIT